MMRMDESSCTDRVQCSVTFLGRGWHAEEIITALPKKKTSMKMLLAASFTKQKSRERIDHWKD